jgi:hypothetical protein
MLIHHRHVHYFGCHGGCDARLQQNLYEILRRDFGYLMPRSAGADAELVYK